MGSRAISPESGPRRTPDVDPRRTPDLDRIPSKETSRIGGPETEPRSRAAATRSDVSICTTDVAGSTAPTGSTGSTGEGDVPQPPSRRVDAGSVDTRSEHAE
jgi:hypothetical protein